MIAVSRFVPARFFVLEAGCDGGIGRWRRSVRPQNKAYVLTIAVTSNLAKLPSPAF